MIFGGRKRHSHVGMFLNIVSEFLFRTFFPTAILPMVYNTPFAQGEPLVQQSSPIVSVFDWVVVLPTLVSARFLAVAIIWVVLTCAPACKPMPRLWPHPPCQGGLKLYPGIVAASTRDSNAPCSGNAALYPLSSPTLSPKSTTLPLYSGKRLARSKCLRCLGFDVLEVPSQ